MEAFRRTVRRVDNVPPPQSLVQDRKRRREKEKEDAVGVGVGEQKQKQKLEDAWAGNWKGRPSVHSLRLFDWNRWDSKWSKTHVPHLQAQAATSLTLYSQSTHSFSLFITLILTNVYPNSQPNLPVATETWKRNAFCQRVASSCVRRSNLSDVCARMASIDHFRSNIIIDGALALIATLPKNRILLQPSLLFPNTSFSRPAFSFWC